MNFLLEQDYCSISAKIVQPTLAGIRATVGCGGEVMSRISRDTQPFLRDETIASNLVSFLIAPNSPLSSA